jgi:hypothetical protein
VASWRLIMTLIVRQSQCLRQRSEFRAVECKKIVYVLYSDMNHSNCAVIQWKGKMVQRKGSLESCKNRQTAGHMFSRTETRCLCKVVRVL